MTEDLARILRENEETIRSAWTEQMAQAGCKTALSKAEDRTVTLEILTAMAAGGEEAAAARRWGDLNATGQKNCCEIITALGCLQRVVRFFLIKCLAEKRSLLIALNRLEQTIDLLRVCTVEAAQSTLTQEAEEAHLESAAARRDHDKLLQVQEALEESRARKTAILESSLDPIITIDHQGMITEFNRAAETVFGRSRKEVIGTRPSEILFPAAKIAGYQNRIDRYLDAGEGSLLSKRNEVIAVRSNGSPFEAELTMTINQEHGKPVLTFFVRDISKRKRAEEEQRRYARQLEQSNRELAQFAYVASHDLQEPLRKICTFGDRLMSGYGELMDETGRECLSRMQNAAGRMQELIRGLLSLSRVTTRAAEFVPVELGEIVQEVVSDLEVKIESTAARVEIGELPSIEADPLQMRQLLQNLIGNALKFHKADIAPLIEIRSRLVRSKRNRSLRGPANSEHCLLSVCDNGIGFDEKYLDRIFDVFQRLHPRDVHEGTGIGLAICRKIVERHGGTITAKSQPDQGAKFVISLPVSHESSEQKR